MQSPKLSYKKLCDSIVECAVSDKKSVKLILGAAVSDLGGIRKRDTLVEEIKKTTNWGKLTRKHKGNPDMLKLIEDFFVWQYYEVNRFYSINYPPREAYAFLVPFVKQGIVSSIVTTNYDSFIDSLVEREEFPHSIIIPSEEFIEPKKNDQGDKIPGVELREIKYNELKKEKKLRIWKIHGTFELLFFFNCLDIIKHPNFMLGPISIEIIDEFGKQFSNTTVHTYHDFPTSSDPLCKGKAALPSHYLHLIDNNHPNKGLLSNVITEAKKDLTDFDNTAAIVAIGFTCRDEKAEELTQAVLPAMNNGIPVIFALSPNQSKPPLSDVVKKIEANQDYGCVIRNKSPRKFLERLMSDCGLSKQIKLVEELFFKKWNDKENLKFMGGVP